MVYKVLILIALFSCSAFAADTPYSADCAANTKCVVTISTPPSSGDLVAAYVRLSTTGATITWADGVNRADCTGTTSTWVTCASGCGTGTGGASHDDGARALGAGYTLSTVSPAANWKVVACSTGSAAMRVVVTVHTPANPATIDQTQNHNDAVGGTTFTTTATGTLSSATEWATTGCLANAAGTLSAGVNIAWGSFLEVPTGASGLIGIESITLAATTALTGQVVTSNSTGYSCGIMTFNEASGATSLRNGSITALGAGIR